MARSLREANSGSSTQKIPHLYEIQRFITFFTRACRWNINILFLCDSCGADAVPVAYVMINDRRGF
jgi:hypothetical protein